jgi:hypothetical protein
MILEEMWRSKLPLKVKNFMWLVQRGRLQTIDNLGRKQWKGSKFWEESIDHLMLECPIAVFVWAVIRDGLKWRNVPKGVMDFRENFLQDRGNKWIGALWFLFGCVCWVLWLNMNDCVFNNKIVSSPVRSYSE